MYINDNDASLITVHSKKRVYRIPKLVGQMYERINEQSEKKSSNFHDKNYGFIQNPLENYGVKYESLKIVYTPINTFFCPSKLKVSREKGSSRVPIRGYLLQFS